MNGRHVEGLPVLAQLVEAADGDAREAKCYILVIGVAIEVQCEVAAPDGDAREERVHKIFNEGIDFGLLQVQVAKLVGPPVLGGVFVEGVLVEDEGDYLIVQIVYQPHCGLLLVSNVGI